MIAGRQTREIILAMANSFSVDGQEWYNGVRDVELQWRAGLATVLVKGVSHSGPTIAAFHGCPPRDIPFVGHIVRRGVSQKYYMTMSTCPGFVEEFSLDGTRLLGVCNVALENGAVRERKWVLNMSSPKVRQYAVSGEKLVMHLRPYPIPGIVLPSVLCLDGEGKKLWSWEKRVDIMSIHVNATLILFLVSTKWGYAVHITDIKNGRTLRVLDLSYYDISPDYMSRIVLTDTHFIFSLSSPMINKILGYDLGELLDDEDDKYLNIWELEVPPSIASPILNLHVSTDGRYIAALTSVRADSSSKDEETTLILWDMKHTLQDGKPSLKTTAHVQRLPRTKKGVFGTGIWLVERVDGDIEISHSDVYT
jgi:hypothetical protein